MEEKDKCCCGHEHGCACENDTDENKETHASHKHEQHQTQERACGCGHCGHTHGEKDEEEHSLPVIIAGTALFIVCLILEHTTAFPWFVYLLLYLIPYLLVGWKTLFESVKNLLHGELFDENFLMSLASVGAFCVGQYEEGVAVMLLYHIGEWLEDLAVGRTRASVRSLMKIRPDKARIVCEDDNDTDEVPVEAVAVGALIEVHPGERIPLDGEIVSGSANLDTAALTGESLPRSVTIGDAAAAGCICSDGVLQLRVSRTANESTVQKILDMAEYAAEKKTKAETFITRFSRVYTPTVVCAAVLLAVVPSLITGNFGMWIYRALTFLVVSCPCALVISVPLSFFCGIGSASKRGILIKGSSAVEALSKAEIVASDKTGTLTRGIFRVTDIVCADSAHTPDELLTLAAYAESCSSHPAARGILTAYAEKYGHMPAPNAVSDIAELSGRGVRAVYDGQTLLSGNEKLMTEHGIAISGNTAAKPGVCVVHIAAENTYLGALHLTDTLKDDAKDAVKALRRAGVREIHMLTGDTEAAARPVADALGLDGCHAALLPDGKMETAERLKASCKTGTLLCLGDGINDAPLLAMADVGCAMGALGSDAAMEAADIVIMDDSPAKAAEAISISRKTMRIAKQNIVFALVVKCIILILGALGITGMWAAVFGDVGVCMLCILNAARLNLR
ncbi:MAG: heavy metal translocating P-type ATPase [Eubacteriales bacterium]